MGRVVKFAETWLEGMRERHPVAYAMAERLVNPNMDESGSIDIRNFVMLGFGAVIVGAFVPMGINALGAADTANFTSTELALYSIVGVAILIAVVMMFINIAA
jgi:hypothetical protein